MAMKMVCILVCFLLMASGIPSQKAMSQPTETFELIQSVEFSSPDPKTMHKAELFGTVIYFPQGRVLKLDHTVMDHLDRNRYVKSKIMLGDVTNDLLDEVFFYQYSTGSAGAMGLNVFSLIDKKWKRIFTDPSVTTTLSNDERFSSEHLGNFRLRFLDQKTELSGVLDMSGFQLSQEQLKKMKFQADPISKYVIHQENVGCQIETVQWIFAFSHPTYVLTVHDFYVYEFHKKTFTLNETKILDNNKKVVASKKYH